MTKFLGGRAHMIEQSRPRRDASRNEQTGRIVKCPVCDECLDVRDLDEVLLHAHDVKFESTEDSLTRQSRD